MTVVSITPVQSESGAGGYRAVAGAVQAAGRTAGEALDALARQLGEEAASTLIVVKHLHPDRYFTHEQQDRLRELMARWRSARDAGQSLAPGEQAELQALVDAELAAAAQRTSDTADELRP